VLPTTWTYIECDFKSALNFRDDSGDWKHRLGAMGATLPIMEGDQSPPCKIAFELGMQALAHDRQRWAAEIGEAYARRCGVEIVRVLPGVDAPGDVDPRLEVSGHPGVTPTCR
jgi:hypothetical protein